MIGQQITRPHGETHRKLERLLKVNGWPSVSGHPSACEGLAITSRNSARITRQQYCYKDRNISRVSSVQG